MGGNLAVLTSLAGTPYFPDLRGALLFLEDVNEYIYRIDRMLTTLALGGHLQQVAGIVLGGFTQCKPSEGSYGSLPLGVPAELDADAGTLRLLEPAVS